MAQTRQLMNARAAYPAAFGLKPDTIRIHRAICRRYPQVKTPCFLCASGGGGDHGEGRALVYMISGSTAGWDIAKWVANAKSLDMSEMIQRQHLGNEVQRAGVRCRTAVHRLPIR